ncbi:ADP-ribosylglycohydrolase family protein [Alsobacter sp. KACC 23698]|uniref:ADP-ribosylglycohydrolase family protein n=1 Tax=Alsobacter sp. KACC 23698 TaxID=3149229 RepID=A0AAU7JBN3_9HYPH
MLPPIQDRAYGALIGLAVGDALGATLEFEERDELPHHTEMLGGGPFALNPGQWTDDTSMAIALAESLIAHPEFDPVDVMKRFVRWADHGDYSCTGTCFDIGITTRLALNQFHKTGEPYAGSTDPESAGNGSIMRLSPVALITVSDAARGRRMAADQCRLTHAAPACIEGCVFLVEVLRNFIRGEESGLSMPRFDCRPISEVAAGTYRNKGREQIRSSGYVVHTLEAALWAVHSTHSFEDALVMAVNLGGDADTVGAVAGQIAGARYGLSAIPKRWLEPLAWRNKLEALASDLVRLG